jgi:trehalose-6-phosphate synthase
MAPHGGLERFQELEEFAESIHLALEMPVEERSRRMAVMRRLVSSNNVFGWAASIITELTTTRTG